ncbi:unnamed protein product [Adineta ricciae]|uniref:Uncharacterized protein n=1 Tax=Adineta ricciae TaxID=249248 RepID=A0A815JKS4_ADIRI|nr:unnamed protein product [Adineta ricciae]
MDDDLAFCLNEFIDEQVQLIDDCVEEIKKEEEDQCGKLEEEQAKYIAARPPPKDKGSHQEEKALVDKFCDDLRRAGAEPSKTRTVIDDPACIASLRAELSAKVNSCVGYLTRLRNLADPLPNSSKFVQLCNDTMDYCRSQQDFEDNFKDLYALVEQSDSDEIIGSIHRWWKSTYGSRIAKINERNQKFNGAITEPNFAVLSPTSRVIAHAKKLIAARQVIPIEPAYFDIVRKFVRKLLAIDEDKRKEVNANELADQLNGMEIEEIIKYAEKWLEERDAIRNQKEEDPYETKIEEARAQCGRKRMAQEAKKLALAALLCRLAVGSGNNKQFDKQLQRTVQKQRRDNEQSIPVISGEIRDPEDNELGFMFQLEANDAEMDQWVNNTNGIRDVFVRNLCEAFGIPNKKIRFVNVDREKGIVQLRVLPPFGKQVVDGLNGGAVDAHARMQAVRKCCLDINANVESITLGEFGLNIEHRLMDPRWNKAYGWEHGESGTEFWSTPINRGGRPYFCPSGWKRFGVKVAEDGNEFETKWGNWYMAYHGTQGVNASKILTSGLKVSREGCFFDDGVPRVYVSPSVEYCGHPRYARPWKRTNKGGQPLWYQLVFQCRVNPSSIKKIGPETLIHDQYKATVTIDPNFSNTELEWIIIGEDAEEYIKNNIICYGLMMRVSDVDPSTLSSSKWWKRSHCQVEYPK